MRMGSLALNFQERISNPFIAQRNLVNNKIINPIFTLQRLYIVFMDGKNVSYNYLNPGNCCVECVERKKTYDRKN